MKMALRKKLPLAMACLIISGILSLPIPALAVWVHGNSGRLDLEGTTSAISFSYVRGWGIDFVPGSNTVYWAHYAIPATLARYIDLKFYTGISSDVTQVDVYDANSLVTTVFVPVGNGLRTLALDMGSNYTFSQGMGISIRCAGGPDAGIGSFQIYAVGASTSSALPAVPMLLLDK
jgi:hypothetical protein